MSRQNPQVSVLMPLRDAMVTVEVAIDSVRQQALKEWELIIVDDGSNDGSSGRLDAMATVDSRIRVEHIAPSGIVAALQRGCELARGEWIARMDGDDRMHPQRLAAQLNHARSYPELGVVSCLVEFGGDAPGYGDHVDWINRLRSSEEISLRRFVEAPVAHPSVMFRRDLLELHGGYRAGDFPEDYELWLRWLDAGVAFGKVEQTLLVWNDSPSRLSRTDSRYAVERFYEVKCHWLARWLRRHLQTGRRLWLWGAGRVTRRRFDALEREGFGFEGFIDIDPKKAGRHRDGRLVRLADDMPSRDEACLLVGVGNRGARDKIRAHLNRRGWIEGRDYLLAA